MPEHCHLLIKPMRNEYFMAEILSAIKGRFANELLKHRADVREQAAVRTPNGESAHRFWERGGGFDRNISSERYIRNSINYIHMNPVRRKLCEGITDWPWSSAASLDGRVPEIAVDYPEF
jgi:putative transposase